MFFICNGYVIGMSSHTFDITYTYQKCTQNFVWVSIVGGIGIYFKQGIQFHSPDDLCLSIKEFESLWIEIMHISAAPTWVFLLIKMTNRLIIFIFLVLYFLFLSTYL